MREMLIQLDVEATDQRSREGDVIRKAWSSGEVDDDARQCFVERHVGVPITLDTGLVADRLCNRLTERDPDVFDGVVRVQYGAELRPLLRHLGRARGITLRDRRQRMGETGEVSPEGVVRRHHRGRCVYRFAAASPKGRDPFYGLAMR